ncbi:MAG: nitrate ABC transporter substrate-binding protein [Coriobacteriia bacterium]|nr:nitrate ABC transporter substrate-binding protein [Coriobacteriia bacterium]
MTAPEASTLEAAGAQTAGEAAAMPAATGAVEPTAATEPTELFDSLFRKRKKNGEWKIVETPDLGVLAVDAHCHLQYQKNPGLALARAGLHGVGFMCTVVDVYEDGTTTYDSLSKWNHEAALSMQRLFSRC